MIILFFSPVVPIIPAVIPAVINPDLVVTDTDTNKLLVNIIQLYVLIIVASIFAVRLFLLF